MIPPVSKSPWAFLGYMLGPFFRAWWAVATGIVSVLAYFGTPDKGWWVGPFGVLGITVLVMVLGFLAVSCLRQGWHLFSRAVPFVEVVGLLRNKEVRHGWLFVIRGAMPQPVGGVIDIHRRMGPVEVPFAIVEVRSETSTGDYQCVPISLASSHISDWSNGKFSTADLRPRWLLSADRIREQLADFAESELDS